MNTHAQGPNRIARAPGKIVDDVLESLFLENLFVECEFPVKHGSQFSRTRTPVSLCACVIQKCYRKKIIIRLGKMGNMKCQPKQTNRVGPTIKAKQKKC